LRELTQPLAAMVANGEVPAEAHVRVEHDGGLALTIEIE